MKVQAPIVISLPENERSTISLVLDLIKARLTLLVLFTTFAGFYAGSVGPISFSLLFHTIFGTFLVAAGAAALNQLLERDYDAQMPRTANRPLPAGKLDSDTALLIGTISSVVGLVQLALGVNLLTSCLGAVTLLTYLFVYTPLKRVTVLNTAIGAIPGALPPLMGWTAARGVVSIEGWALFAILFFWQLPHFLAIAWMYRDQYERAGFVMLPVVDQTGERTGRQALCHTFGLLPVSLSPFLFGMAGIVYLAGALSLGIIFIYFAWQFSRTLNTERARQLFLMSIIYLPLILGLLAADKLRP